MDTQTTTPATEAVTPAPAKKPVRQIKVSTDKPAKKATAPATSKTAIKPKPGTGTTRQAAAPKTNQHVEHGLKVASYTGVSTMINNNRQARVMVAPKRATGSLTERHQKSLYALRDAYNGARFGVKGFDNGIIRDLMAAGLVKLVGGTTESLDGKTYHVDGPTALQAQLTPEGLKYGKV